MPLRVWILALLLALDRAEGEVNGVATGRAARYAIVSGEIASRPSSSTAEQWTFNPLVQGSNPWGATRRKP